MEVAYCNLEATTKRIQQENTNELMAVFNAKAGFI